MGHLKSLMSAISEYGAYVCRRCIYTKLPIAHEIYYPFETNTHKTLPLLKYSSIDESDYGATIAVPVNRK